MTRIGVAGERARLSTAHGVRSLSQPERCAYAVSALLIASGIAHLGVQAVLGGPWWGPVSWRKPVTFGLSFGLTLATITWVTGYLAITPARRARLLAVFGFACVLEVLVITTQAWRRVPSHFNLSTPLNAAFAYTAAFGGGLIIVTTVLFGIAAFRQNQNADPAMDLAVRTGFVTFAATLAIGAAMIAIGSVTARTVSQDAAYSAASGLKYGHAALMHGILILPVLAWLLTFTDLTPGQRYRVVQIACAVYVLIGGGVVLSSIVAV